MPASHQTSPDAKVVQARLDGSTAAGASQDFRPPEPMALPAKVTFDQAVTTTLAADPKIRAGLELITQARGDLLTSSLYPNPTLIECVEVARPLQLARVRVKASDNFTIGMQFDAIPDVGNPGFWILAGPLPRYRGRW